MGNGSQTSGSRATVATEPAVRSPPAGPVGGPPQVAGSRYIPLETIGSGGMGHVVRAYDPHLQREVALKELRRDALGPDGAVRLIAEARAMAKLANPHVVAVFDVEQGPSGELVLVMEYVAGETLRDWVHRGSRAWPEIVATFRAAGRGLAAAHAAGVLHRDFKPDNVLVSTQHGGAPDGARVPPIVKVTDFGLAKAGAWDPTARGASSTGSIGEPVTEAGVVLGTPRYMAPEQFGRAGRPLTPAADQYAFAVALWEALCGPAPFADDDVAGKHAGPPTWPRKSVPRPIARAILRALGVAPEDRWPSMNALLDALAWEPGKTRRRVGWAVAGAGALGAAALSWSWRSTSVEIQCSGARDQLAGRWDDARRADVREAVLGVERTYAGRVWAQVEPALDHYADEWAAMHRDACEATTTRGEQTGAVMDLRMACLHRAAVDLAAVTSEFADADADVLGRAHRLVGGLPPVSRCGDVDALQQEIAPPLPAEADTVDAIRTHVAQGVAAMRAGRYPRARSALERARAAMAGVASYGPVRSEVALAEGTLFAELGDARAAEHGLREAFFQGARWNRRDDMANAASMLVFVLGCQQQRPDAALAHAATARGLSAGAPKREASVHENVGCALQAKGAYDQAEQEYRRAVALWDRIDADAPGAGEAHGNLGLVLFLKTELGEAETEARRAVTVLEAAYGPDHPALASMHNNLANVLRGQGRYAEAEAAYTRAMTLWTTAHGPDHLYVGYAHNNIGIVQLTAGRLDEAAAAFERSRGILRRALGPDHPDVGKPWSNLASVYVERGEYAHAEAAYRDVLAFWIEAHGETHGNVAQGHEGLANALHAHARYAEAVVEIRRAVEIRTALVGADNPHTASTRSRLAQTLAALGDDVAAEAEHRRAFTALDQSVGPDHPQLADAALALASFLVEHGRASEARPFAEQAWARNGRDDVDPPTRAETAYTLAQTLAPSDDPDDRTRAITLADLAARTWRQAGDTYAAQSTEAGKWSATIARR